MANKKKKKTNNNIKNEKKKIENISEKTSDNVWHIFIVVCVIIIFLCSFYILAVRITNSKGETKKKGDGSVSISYSNTIVGRILSMKEKEYLVVLYDKDDSDNSTSISSAIGSYGDKKKHLTVYTVDMSDGLNKKYVGTESNTTPSKLSDIVINGPTLMKIRKGKVIEYVEGTENIENYLK